MRSAQKFLSPALKLVGIIVLGLLAADAQDAPKPEIHGIDVANMDRSVKPGDNFHLYCNGDWIKRTEIPPDRSRLSVFATLADVSDTRTAALVEEAAKNGGPAGSSARKIAVLYSSYMDEGVIEAKGLAPLHPHLKAIAAIRNKKELAAVLGETLRADVDALNNTNFHTPHLFGLWVAPGFNDSDHYAAYLLQGGLQLPDREYYLSNSEQMRDIRTKYQAHVSAMLKLAGFTDTDARAERIVALEHAIAEKHLTLAENDDIHQANNTWKRADFVAKAPGLDWAEYFRGAGLSKQASFIVWQPTAFAGESALVASTPLDTWKDWLAYHMIEEYGDVLPKALADERFAFFGNVLQGSPEQRPRWQRGVVIVNRYLGDDVGKIYA
jgi:endothelin-converting enzyme/putative endopeptidase